MLGFLDEYFVHTFLEIAWVFLHYRHGSVPIFFQGLHEILLLGRIKVQGCGEILSNDAVRKAKLVKGNGSFGRQTIFQALLEKL